MRHLLLLFAITSIAVFAQDAPPGAGGGRGAGRGAGGGGGRGAPHTNLKVLSEAEFADGAMRKAATGLGVMCNDCHNPTDRASDEKPMKLTAISSKVWGP